MAGRIPKETLDRIAQVLDLRVGFHFPHARHADLERSLVAAAADSGAGSLEDFVDLIGREDCPPAIMDKLVGRISVGETYFFRHTEQFEALKNHVLLPLAEARRDEARASGKRPRISLWCAAGSSGEEAYSLAMLLRSFLPDIALWDISIASSDVNPAALSRARKAEYGQWSFRGVPDSIRRTWFAKTEKDRFRVVPDVKSMVSFMRFNLADTAWDLSAAGIPRPDIIFCRNVLLYFSRAGIEGVLRRLFASIAPGGWLVVGPSEAMSVMQSEFETVSFQGTTLFRRPPDGRIDDGSAFRGQAPRTLPEFPKPRLKSVASPVRPAPPGAAPDPRPDRPGHPGLLDYSEARKLADLGRTEEAGRLCDRALAADRTNPDYQYLHAILAMERRDLDSAASALRRALYLKPDFIMAHYTLGNVEALRGNRAQSMRHYRNALAGLGDLAADAILPESDGIPAGRLALTISRTLNRED